VKTLIRLKRTKKSIDLFNVFNYTLMIIMGAATLYPFLHVIAISFNDSVDTVRGGITIFPRVFTLDSYKQILTYDGLITGWWISALRTGIGTATGLLCTAMLAYTLSREDYFARKFVTGIFMVTMYVGGGLIPDYMLIRHLHLFNNFMVYIIPGLVGVFNVIVIRSYIDGLPYELQESAKLDGANDLIICFRIVLPLCTPVLSVMALFSAVGHWNSWFDTYLYCNGNPQLTTLQFELQKILQQTQILSDGSNPFNKIDPNKHITVSPKSVQMAMTMVATLPILIVYPFVQNYFVKGMTIGAVKS
jgi:putative aldouronate transport system permease protein